jgi:hypothetical protein
MSNHIGKESNKNTNTVEDFHDVETKDDYPNRRERESAESPTTKLSKRR